MTESEKIAMLISIWHLTVIEMNNNKSLRKGQTIFNVCYRVQSLRNKVNELRGTDKDCFYNDDKIYEFLTELFL